MSASAIPNVLTIAGSDSGGGAGIQADIKTCSALKTYACSVITAVTAQNTQRVTAVQVLSKKVVASQLRAVFDDINISAVKIGMLANAEIVCVVADLLKEYKIDNIVLDPVMIAKSGDQLISDDAIDIMKEALLPQVTLITPNLPEAARLLNQPEAKNLEEMEQQLEKLSSLTSGAILLKGGHLDNESNECIDLLRERSTLHQYTHPRLRTNNTHGTGCTLSAAIAAYLAHGKSLPEAVSNATHYVHRTIAGANRLSVGSGHGPLLHFYDSWNAN